LKELGQKHAEICNQAEPLQNSDFVCCKNAKKPVIHFDYFFRSVTERQPSVITDFVEVENNRIEETKNIGKFFSKILTPVVS
jgi:hypothetical protein